MLIQREGHTLTATPRIFLFEGCVCFKSLERCEGLWIAENVLIVDSTSRFPTIKRTGNPHVFDSITGFQLIKDVFLHSSYPGISFNFDDAMKKIAKYEYEPMLKEYQGE